MKKMSEKNGYAEASVTKKNYRVDLSFIGEGYDGDYDEKNPEDKPLLRFDVYKKNEEGFFDIAEQDASCCTNIPATIPVADAKKIANYICLRFINNDKMGKKALSIKQLAEELSHLSDSDLKNIDKFQGVSR